MTILVLNYAHPLSEPQLATLTTLLGAAVEVRQITSYTDRQRPLVEVAYDLAEAANLSVEAWQLTAFVLNPPSLAPLALALIAECHGRIGGFPAILNIRPVADTTPLRYELAEVVNLQAIRDAARRQR